MSSNRYRMPVDASKVTKTSEEGVAHVGDLIHSIDFDAPEGTDVFAALDGTVTAMKDDSDKGGDDPSFEAHANYIEIGHDGGETSEYEHLRRESAVVRVGDRVTAGQKIAEVGNTGWSECPHLHFMVYPTDAPYKTVPIDFGDARSENP